MSLEPEVAESAKRIGENTPFLAGFHLPKSIAVTLDAEEAVKGADLVVLVFLDRLRRRLGRV